MLDLFTLSCPASTVELLLNVKDAQIQLLTDPISDCHHSSTLLTCSSLLANIKEKDEGGAAVFCEEPPWGLFLSPKKKHGGTSSSKETTYDFYGCCPDGCHPDFDAFMCCSRVYFHFDPWSLDRTMRSQRTLGTKHKAKKKTTTCLGRFAS